MKNNKYIRHIFICLFFTITLFIFESIYLPFISDQMDLPVQLSGYFFTFASFILVFFFTYFALSSPYVWRIVYFFIFSTATIVEFGYYKALRHFSTAEDLENVIFGTNLDNKFDAVMIYFNWIGFIPCLAFLILLLVLKPFYENGWKYLGIISLAASGFFLTTGYFTKNHFPIISSAAYYRTIIGSPFKLNYLNLTPRQAVEPQGAEKPTNNIVFIVDESISGNHLSVNGYHRQTTPFLDELNEKGFIRNWGLAVSGTPCSITSNKLLLTGITDLPDTKLQVLNYPIIFQYAKAMGYKTFYFDGQMDNLWSLSDFDRQFIDEHITKEKLQTRNDYDIDAEIARQTGAIVNRSMGNFIWINKRGTHIPYHKAYPKTEEKWSPVFFDDPFPVFAKEEEARQAYINSHDNAVRYNLQLFFTTLLGGGVDKNTFYLYTSDHGQNLKEDPRQGSHCGDLPQQTIVPLFMISDSSQFSEVDTSYKASHSNIFAALLDLMSFPQEKRQFKYDISLLKATAADSMPRYYFVGNLTGDGNGKKILFEERIAVSKK